MTGARPRVGLSYEPADDVIRYQFEGLSRGRAAELELLWGPEGGIPGTAGGIVPVLGFRRTASDLGALLTSFDADVETDDATGHILRAQLDEIRARRAAESDSTALDAADVRARVMRSGRFGRQLTDQQERDLGRVLRLAHGANFSVPGAGKTTALLAVYEAVRAEGHVDRLLVVAPKNAFLSWEQELEADYPEGQRPRLARLAGGRSGTEAILDSDPEIVLVSYQLLPNVLDLVIPWAWHHAVHVVLDESHRVKSGQAGVIASAALRLAGVSKRRDILSGTPLPQAPEDLRPQLDFLWPGQRIMPEVRVVAEAPDEMLADVERRVRPLYVRTTKIELNIPALTGPVPVLIDLGPIQRELYDLLRSEAARVASGMPIHDRAFFRSLGRQVVRLLQVASNPMLLTQTELTDNTTLERPPQEARAWDLLRDFARYEQPAKVAEAVRRAEAAIAQNKKVLIWSGFVLNLTSLARLLDRHNPVVLYGQVETGDADDPDTREGRIRRFHDDETCRVMIANPAACGEGISLHKACHYAIYLDRSFNAAHFVQSVDRIHRLGLEPGTETLVEVLEARGTIDQRVSQRLKAKIDAMARILNDHGLAALAYDPDDVIEEFPGGLDPEDVEEVMDHLFEPEDA